MRINNLSIYSAISLVLFGLAACSSKDDSNSSSAPTATVIDQNNLDNFSQILTEDTYLLDYNSQLYGSDFLQQMQTSMSTVIPGIGSVLSNIGQKGGGSGNTKIQQQLLEGINAVATVCNTDALGNHVDGDLSYNLVSPTSFTFSGGSHYSDLCVTMPTNSQDIVVNGDVAISGDQNGVTVTLSNLSFKTPNVENGAQSNSLNCSMKYDLQATQLSNDCDATNSVSISVDNPNNNSSLHGVTIYVDGFYYEIAGRLDTPDGFINIATQIQLSECAATARSGFGSGILNLSGGGGSSAQLNYNSDCVGATWTIGDPGPSQISNTIYYGPAA